MERMYSFDWIKMTWCIFVTYVLTILLNVPYADSVTLPPVHWNSSNPMFKTSNNDHVIEVNLFDKMDFICPFHPTETSSGHEYYVIYMVSKREYDDCNIYSDPSTSHSQTTMLIVNCSNPKTPKVFTILFDDFSSIPNVPEYQRGGVYYFITTSTGHYDGIMNPHQGACLFKNMKLTIKVCCDTTTTLPPSAASNVTVPAMGTGSSPGGPVATPPPATPPQTPVHRTDPHLPATTTMSTSTVARPVSTTRTHRRSTEDTPTPRQRYKTTTRPDYKYTNKIPDKNKPKDKEKPGDENETYPKHEEQRVSSASSHSHSTVLLASLATLVLYTFSYAWRT